ncbi:hypothetical protein SAMD00019534_034270, partial [Acytostelium subglobosum LB1]|uniref:hypothetical protein n=1 Tax=Acytostelium subglobosum LB1 TaxID=1410327 RepID=UPI000645027B
LAQMEYQYSSSPMIQSMSTSMLLMNTQKNNNMVGNDKRSIFFSSYIANNTQYKMDSEDEIFSEVKESIAFEKLGNYSASKAVLNRSRDIVERQLGKKHPITLNVLFRLIDAEMAIGELAPAQKLCQTILERLDHSNPEMDRYTFPSLNNLILCFQYQGDLQSAVDTADKLATLAEARSDWTLMIGTLLNKAIIMALQCNDDCKQVFDQCVTLLKDKNIPTTNILYETVNGNYASYSHSVADDSEAEELFQTALKYAEQNNNQPELSNILTNYAEFLLSSEQFDRAEKMCELASNQAEKTYGRDSPKLGMVIFILARLFNTKGNHAWAEGYFNKCIRLFEDYRNRTMLQQREQSNTVQEQTPNVQLGKREIEMRTNKEVDIDYGSVLWEYAQMLRSSGRLKEAVNLEERARKLNAIDDD